MRSKMEWAALGAVVALLLRREVATGDWRMAVLVAVIGAVVGYGIAWLVRRGA